MGRQKSIARSISQAITSAHGNGTSNRSPRNPLGWLLTFFSALFSLYKLTLRKIRPAEFGNLRRNYWKVTDDTYIDSFLPREGTSKGDAALSSIGDMGFSGSVSRASPYSLYTL